MRQELPDTSTLASILAVEAAGCGLMLAHDTHYDANNWGLSRWQGSSAIESTSNPCSQARWRSRITAITTPVSRSCCAGCTTMSLSSPFVARVEWEWVGSCLSTFEAAQPEDVAGGGRCRITIHSSGRLSGHVNSSVCAVPAVMLGGESPCPGVRGAEGPGKRQGVTARWGPKAAWNDVRGEGHEPETRCGYARGERARDREALHPQLGVLINPASMHGRSDR